VTYAVYVMEKTGEVWEKARFDTYAEAREKQVVSAGLYRMIGSPRTVYVRKEENDEQDGAVCP
jgi:hypothetical protein